MSGSHPASRDMDMLHGPVARKMLVFALPVALTGLFQQLFTAADIFVLGRFVGKEAMAAAGNNIPAISLIINLYTGLALGANVVIARCIGSGDRNGTRSAVQTAVLLSLISGIAIAAMGVPLSRTVTELLGVPEEVFTMSEDYLRIYFYGIPALAFFNFAAAILRSRGDTRTPLFALIQSTILNIVLNLAFVKAGWGLSGVVWATDIANYWAAVFLFIGLIRTPGSVRLVLAGMRADMGHLKEILRIGLPAGVQLMVFAIANICLQQSINSLGADAMAASAAAFTVEINVYCVIASFGQAVTTFVSQNYGAGNLRRCRLCTRTGILAQEMQLEKQLEPPLHPYRYFSRSLRHGHHIRLLSWFRRPHHRALQLRPRGDQAWRYPRLVCGASREHQRLSGSSLRRPARIRHLHASGPHRPLRHLRIPPRLDLPLFPAFAYLRDAHGRLRTELGYHGLLPGHSLRLVHAPA